MKDRKRYVRNLKRNGQKGHKDPNKHVRAAGSDALPPRDPKPMKHRYVFDEARRCTAMID